MNLKILGTRGEIEPSARYHSNHSGIILDQTILLDCGEKKFLEQLPDYILITHLHPDHAFFVRDPQEPTSIATPIYAPEIFHGNTKVIPFNHPIQLGSYLVTPIPTIHSHRVASQAYLITKDNKKILYTGDMIWIEKKYHALLANLDLVVTEASFIDQGGFIKKHPVSGKLFGHTGIPNLIRFFQPFTQHLVLVHFGSWFYQDIQLARKKIKALSKQSNINITVGYDGLEIPVI
ncbi:MAG: MBL fold metallo-hydrolase [Proteobacteria bacterium]|nr:MBL fold metallo-hydrolase [Pseudomonadota bacterium]